VPHLDVLPTPMGFVLHRLPHENLRRLPSCLGDAYGVTSIDEHQHPEGDERRLQYRVTSGRGSITVTQWSAEEFDDKSKAIVFITQDHPVNPFKWRADFQTYKAFLKDMKAHGLEEIPVEEYESTDQHHS